MKPNRFSICLAVAIAATTLATVVHGRLTNRWGTADRDRAEAAARLQQVPVAFGDWELQKETQLEDRVLGILQCTGSWRRDYVHRPTGQLVVVVMIIGPPGQTSTHTPEMCYSTQGFTQLGGVERLSLDGTASNQHEFHRVKFTRDGLARDEMEVCYAWRQKDRWTVPGVPRVAFGGGTYLYKMQLASLHDAGHTGSKSKIDCEAFLKEFLPVLDRTIFQTPIP